MSIHFSVARGEGDMRKEDYDPDKDTIISPPQVPEICPETIGLLKKYVISDDLIYSYDAEVSQVNVIYVKKKEITIGTLYPTPSTLRIKFDLKYSAYTAAYGRIYKNGGAIGTERSTSSDTYVTFSEDIEFEEGDTIQLYLKSGNVEGYSWSQNLRIYGKTQYLTLVEALPLTTAGKEAPFVATNTL